jgi:hypothetical protein
MKLPWISQLLAEQTDMASQYASNVCAKIDFKKCVGG